MSEDYISQFYTWSTGNTITAARLNGNVSNVTDGLSGGSKAANLGKLLVGGTEVINSSRAIIATGVTLSGDITSTGTAVDWDLQDNVASALSFDASGKTGLLEFVTTNSGEGLNTSGFLKIVSDAASLTAVGAFVLGAGGDAGLFFNGTDLTIQTDGAGASGIIFDSEDDTFEFKGSGTLQATFDTTGLNLVSGDVFKINGTSVLSNDTLGSNVVNTSITSTGALNSGSITSGFGNIDVGSSNIDGGTITADTGFTGNLSGTATNATHVTVTDNESTDEDNLITFVEDATSSTGNVGLEMDGNLTYNPSTGRLTATQLSGTLQTAAQANITSVGTLSSLTVSGDATFDTSTLKVDSSNNRVGIGLSSPSHRLHVDNSSLNSGNTGTVAKILASGTTSSSVTVLNVQNALYVTANGVTSGDLNDTSDICLKKNVRDFQKTGLEILKDMKPRIFDWIQEDKGDNIFGFVAQELEEVMPTAVMKGKIKSINVTAIVSVLVKSVQELKSEIDTLKGGKS